MKFLFSIIVLLTTDALITSAREIDILYGVKIKLRDGVHLNG